MTINRKRLKRIIKEEVQKYLSEYDDEVRWEVPDEWEEEDEEEEDPLGRSSGDSGDFDDYLHPDNRRPSRRNSWGY